MKFVSRPLVLSLLALLLALAPAGATTYMMMSDNALADQAVAVVDVKVVGADSAPTVDGPPSTDYLVEVSRVLKGDVPGSTLLVRVPGGINPLGLGLKIWGAPQFGEGEEAILFLSPARDGTYRILHLMLGAFHKRILNGRAVAVRDLSEANEVVKGAAASDEDPVRDYGRFSDWVADRALGAQTDAGYVLAPLGEVKAGLGSATAPYTFLLPGDGHPIRWFRFDRNQTADWRVNDAGQPGLGLAATIAAFKTGIDTWNAESRTNIRYSYIGTTQAGQGLARSDGVNAILFDDPFQDDPDNAVDGSFSCGLGGVIAVGGPFFFQTTRAYRGVQYHEAVEADIVTNDGTECLFRNNPAVAEEVFAHELGHTLGLGHSVQPNSLMRASVHNDSRGAQLHDDDRAAVAVLYGDGSTGGNNNGGGGGAATLTAPARQAGRAISSTEVSLTWRDKAKGEASYRVEMRTGKKGAFREVLVLPADSTSAVVSDLAPGTSYTFRIRAEAGGRFSPFSKNVVVTTPR